MPIANPEVAQSESSAMYEGVADKDRRTRIANQLIEEVVVVQNMSGNEYDQQKHHLFRRFEYNVGPDAKTSPSLKDLDLSQRIDIVFAAGCKLVDKSRSVRTNG